MALGVGRFESVSILGFNSPEWLLSNNGAIAAGGFAAGIYTTNEPPACKYIVDHCNARVIVVEGQKQLDKILAIRAEPTRRTAISYAVSCWNNTERQCDPCRSRSPTVS